MMLTKEQVRIVEEEADKFLMRTVGNWIASNDFAAFIVGDESPSSVGQFVKTIHSRFGMPVICGRLDDLHWQNAMHTQLEWVRIGYKIPCPLGAKVNGVALSGLPQFVQCKFMPTLQRRFVWKFQASDALGEAII